MKVSKYRHTRGHAARPEKHFMGVQATGAIWDCSNMMAVNSKFVAVPWASMGSTAVLRHDQYGKLPSTPNLLRGHSGHVIDVAFSPFDDELLFTASEDCNVCGWRIPEDGLSDHIAEPLITLSGHGKKVGILAFHPSARGVLASAGTDSVINLWDVEAAKPRAVLRSLSGMITSVNWNLDGALINATTKEDKRVHVLDSRSGNVVASADSHEGSKTQRSVWAKRRDVIVTLGFNKKQHRQLMVWDLRNMQKPQHVEEIDQQSSVMMPFMDEDTNMLYVGGKGESSIRYYELWNGPTPIVSCASYSSTEPQKALAMLPKTMMDVKNCEVARFYKVGPKSMHTVSMLLPRKESQMEFQEDVYPPTFARDAAISANEFFEGTNSAPRLLSLRGLFDDTPLVAAEATPAQQVNGNGNGAECLPTHTESNEERKEEPLKKQGNEEPLENQEKEELPEKESKEESPEEEPKKDASKRLHRYVPEGGVEKEENDAVGDNAPSKVRDAPSTATGSKEIEGSVSALELEEQRALVSRLQDELTAATEKLRLMENAGP